MGLLMWKQNPVDTWKKKPSWNVGINIQGIHLSLFKVKCYYKQNEHQKDLGQIEGILL